jgi:hypothetical protein
MQNCSWKSHRAQGLLVDERRVEDNIKMDNGYLRYDGMKWIQLANMIQWRALVNTLLKMFAP